MTHLSLFSGIGGLDLAAEMAGFTTVGQCEWADYPTKILEKHWPDVPRWRDIRTLTKESFHEKTGLWTIDVLSGGFPCQPFSTAGQRRGKDDDRYLWPEMLRVVREIRPTWIVGENVTGIISMAIDTVLSDLETEGYSVQAFVVPACAVDAPHRRDRVAIVAHTDCKRLPEGKQRESQQPADCSKNDSDADGKRLQGFKQHEAPDRDRGRQETCGSAGELGEAVSNAKSTKRQREEQSAGAAGISGFADCGWWPAEPGVGRMAHGIPNRVDRIRCLGNAVVPQQFYPFFRAIAEIEGGERDAEADMDQ